MLPGQLHTTLCSTQKGSAGGVAKRGPTLDLIVIPGCTRAPGPGLVLCGLGYRQHVNHCKRPQATRHCSCASLRPKPHLLKMHRRLSEKSEAQCLRLQLPLMCCQEACLGLRQHLGFGLWRCDHHPTNHHPTILRHSRILLMMWCWRTVAVAWRVAAKHLRLAPASPPYCPCLIGSRTHSTRSYWALHMSCILLWLFLIL
mmetsp:Transcript_36332/g.85236  ORF Transcript_36332/g.85236 Transcript_36332/m.85236 type:complete len:200 (+) Transcript_36332:1289-1888(+)